MNESELCTLVDEPARRREVSAVEFVEALLSRIEERNGRLNAYIALTPDLALDDARRVDAARTRSTPGGALDGLPMAIKDNIDVAGTPATAGSDWFRDRVPEHDAETVRRLREAGAVILGKTALHEFAYGATTDNPHFGTCRNPWDPSRMPGGSSGGSGAALGADLCLGALGTDTGGSVRVPAAFNGVSALRPTYGAISNRGVLSLCPSLDTVGPMARSIVDVARIAAIVTGYDRDDPYAVAPPAVATPRTNAAPAAGEEAFLRGIRIGVAAGFFFEDVEPAVAANARAAADVLGDLGAGITEIAVPDADRAGHDCAILIRAEALAEHRERLEKDPGRIGEDVRRRLALGYEVSGVQVAESLARMRRWQAQLRLLFDDIDLILTPCTPVTAPLIEGADMIATSALVTRLCYPWSLGGLPSIAAPSGLDERGLPTGLQLAAAPWCDVLALRVGAAYQRATDFHRLRPGGTDGA